MMESFLDRARTALLDFQEQTGVLQDRVESTNPTRQLPEKRLRRLSDLAEEATAASIPLLDSLELIEKTALAVVDMETRMIGESKALARTLSDLGKQVGEQFFIREEFAAELIELEESAQFVAAALYPSAVQALNFVNSKIWEFSRLQMSRYRRLRDQRIQSEKLKGKPLEEIEALFSALEAQFDNADRFLQELALRRLSRQGVATRRGIVRRALSEAETVAAKASESKSFRPFRSVLRDSRKVAGQVRERIDALRVPLFPEHNELEELESSIDRSLYDNLTGLQLFALLNIASRMREIKADGGHLLAPEFEIRIWKAFPDRIYLDADASLLQAVVETGEFERANASLHRFNEGSLKQTTFAQGNLQVSFQTNADGTVSVDADIDLYRDPVLHFFGEVFVNHLTGSKTDPYKVRKFLDQQGVMPMGGFEIFPT